MTDTYSSPTQSTSNAAAMPTVDPHQAAQDRLAALLEELKADQLKPAAPKTDEVPSFSTDEIHVQRPKSGLTQSQPTVEEQIELSNSSSMGAYAQMMQKVNQKYKQGSPSLTDLLGMLKSAPAPAPAPAVSQSVSSAASVPSSSAPMSTDMPAQSFDSPEFLAALSKLPNPVPSVTANPAETLPTLPVAQSAAKPRVVNLYLRKLSANLKQFGKLDLASFHAAK